nr:D site-binding protein [Halyomorpha halys]
MVGFLQGSRLQRGILAGECNLERSGGIEAFQQLGGQPPLYLPPPHHHYPTPILPLPQPDLKAFRSIGSPRRPRSEKKPIPEEQKDERYYERRKRNNQAAKKSRDARRLREDQIALRASMLEHENAILRAQVITLREEAQSLRELLLHQQKYEALDVCTI